jgi:hypothetical protein
MGNLIICELISFSRGTLLRGVYVYKENVNTGNHLRETDGNFASYHNRY